jgi:hypothetical protein
MKRLLSVGLFGVAVALLGGCPVYSGDSSSSGYCDGDGCYTCPSGNQSSGQCSPLTCNSSYDCPSGYYCGSAYTCQSYGSEDAGVIGTTTDATTAFTSCSSPSACPQGYTCGVGGACELGNCEVTGCVSGYVCALENGTVQCVSEDAGTVPPFDAGAVACQSSSDCSVAGALCLDGQCVAPANQCFDETQCPSGDRCVAGACTPTCGTDDGGASCPTGYACNVVADAGSGGVCSGNSSPCEANPSVCTSGTVCAQNHCVAPCGTNGSCPTGEECLQGGCVPNELAQFTCNTDGVQDACALGSICLHHRCYIACSPDAGAPDDAGSDAGSAGQCPVENDLNQCKPVYESGNAYYVCGSSTNLGTQCNPTTGLACPSSSSVCIDGYCD